MFCEFVYTLLRLVDKLNFIKYSPEYMYYIYERGTC